MSLLLQILLTLVVLGFAAYGLVYLRARPDGIGPREQRDIHDGWIAVAVLGFLGAYVAAAAALLALIWGY